MLDKSIHEIYEQLPYLTPNLFIPRDTTQRYGTYYAEDRLYFVFDYMRQAIFFTKADSPKDAIKRVENLDLVYYMPQRLEDDYE